MPDRVEALDSGILEIRLLVGLIDSGQLGTERSSDAQRHPYQGRRQSRKWTRQRQQKRDYGHGYPIDAQPIAPEGERPGCDGESCKQSNFPVEWFDYCTCPIASEMIDEQ